MKKSLLMLLAFAGVFTQGFAGNSNLVEENSVQQNSSVGQTTDNVGKLTVYKAKVAIKKHYRESYSRQYIFANFKAGDFITDSQAQFYTIKNHDKVNYLYGGECDSDYGSCLIPKSQVSATTYQMGRMPVSALKGRISFKHGEQECKMFIGYINGHHFYKNDYNLDKYVPDYENEAKFQKFLAIDTEYGLILIPVKGDYVDFYNEKGQCITWETDWYNFDYRQYDDYPKFQTFDQNGNLIRDLYQSCDKPDWWESICYIPSINSIYVGKGQFISLDR